MKSPTVLVIATCLIFQGAGAARPADFPKLTGPYLGQKPPGMTPEVFAPGIVSTAEFREFSGTFTPDGKEYYFFRVADGAGMMATKLTSDGRRKSRKESPCEQLPARESFRAIRGDHAVRPGARWPDRS